MKFVAKKMGYYKNRRIKPGEVFDFEENYKPSWAEPVKEEVDTKPAKKKKSSKKVANVEEEKKEQEVSQNLNVL